MLQKLAALLAQALLNAAIAWIKDPANADDVKAAGNFIADRVAETIPAAVDQVTNLIPGQWDDKIIDPLVAKLAPSLASLLAGQFNLGRVIGGLGGLLGGNK
ncbi:hypothetical protein BTO20_11550 [Mycobacterium dioxanotrophicus]|uniref:Uncharacterized protein n=1 Tax=Mycobacterium dioxanotrophicus TaxID=482462 RepID=A0A1Y0C1S0_9MYCO|nr:hypothetical protein [Mycobacterium dioxanotrophicus]ART69131.1 hypothetical protein BTO20_11550 [Mycobacterium dioxanotrophicus]